MNCSSTLSFDIALNIKEHTNEAFLIYPNPADDYLMINDQQSLINIEFKIYGVNCKLIKFGVTENDFIDISDLEPGIYNLIFQDNFNSTYRFIKN